MAASNRQSEVLRDIHVLWSFFNILDGNRLRYITQLKAMIARFKDRQNPRFRTEIKLKNTLGKNGDGRKGTAINC